MKKILFLICVLFGVNSVYAKVEEVFIGSDVNELKAGAAKYFMIKGANVHHINSYEANNFQAVEKKPQGAYGSVTYYYNVNFIPVEKGTKLELVMMKSSANDEPHTISLSDETSVLNGIKASMTGKFLYGLGFEYDLYDFNGEKIKAPKGKETGIVLTAVNYDAKSKGLMAGDKIISINNVSIKDMPVDEYSKALFAKSINDTLTLTYKRGNNINTVTLKPKRSKTRVF